MSYYIHVPGIEYIVKGNITTCANTHYSTADKLAVNQILTFHKIHFRTHIN